MNTTSTPKEHDYQLIQRFFDFELNEIELAALEQRMQEDEDFVTRMQLYQRMEKQVDTMNSPSATFAKTVTLSPKKAKRFQLRTLRAAAAMLVLAIGCLFVFWMFNQNTDTSALAQQAWNATDKITFSETRTTGETPMDQSLILEASKLFDQGDWQGTLNQLETIRATNSKAALLRGEALFEQEAYQLAIEQFEIVKTAPNSEHKDLAYWFQALSYLQIEEVEIAKENLKYIIEQQYPLQGKAQALLDEL